MRNESDIILITGGTGFIGSALVRRLVLAGNHVRVLDSGLRGNAKRLADIEGRFEFISGDIRDKATVDSACAGASSIFHLAYLNGTEHFYKRPELVLDIAVKGMANVIDGALKQGVKEFFLASSSEVYQTPPVTPTDETAPLIVPDPLNPRYSYGGGKILCELMAINYGRKNFDRMVIFRPHNVIGPDMGLEHVVPQFALRLKSLAAAQKDGIIPFPLQGTGTETRAFIDIRDFTDGLMLLKERGEHLNIYHIGTQNEVSIQSVAELVADCFGRKIELQPGPLTAGSTLRRCPDISKMRRLGFTPETPLQQTIQKLVSWYDAGFSAEEARQILEKGMS